MAFNILDAVKGYLTPDMIGKAASYLGESDSSLAKAASGMVPAALAGIVQKAETGGANTIFDLAKKAFSGGILDNLGNTFSHSGGGIPDYAPGMLSGIFGDKVGHIANTVAQWAGIKGSSAASLLGSVAPLILGLLGKNASDNGLSASGLLSSLTSQKNSILSALPAGLGLSGLFGGTSEPARTATMHQHHEPPKKSGSWLMPLLLGIAAVALLLYLVKGCGGGHKETEHATEPVVADTAKAVVEEPVKPAASGLKLKLADGTEIDVHQGGFEYGLVTCLNDAACEAGKDKWFDFDDVNFDVNSAKLTESSMRQINNIATILKAYPKAKIKIGGYTDKTGNEAANKKLSQERADAVLAAIKATGANAAQLLGAEGYGSEFAKVAATASEDERRPDRRMSVQLREK
ncbi:OmpA family protein [Flavihumibacter petaseus]|uniref:Putative OmpA family protein n=1 Tax=Flavihumibacter petaseus NBRC 106054 TaxID=1220578 RepID=A0A0E9N6S2_9BACT|nr:OmpA family protein [Flavihumibacter petaseus]GAO45045.1 putative OmpA family protein [Flavihumibacter petaseus NBRC 106054]